MSRSISQFLCCVLLIASSQGLSSASAQETNIAPAFPLQVKLLGYMATNDLNKKPVVLLEIDDQTIVLQAGQKYFLEHPALKQSSSIGARAGENSRSTASAPSLSLMGGCTITFEPESLDPVGQTLLLGTAPFDTVRCALGKPTRPRDKQEENP